MCTTLTIPTALTTLTTLNTLTCSHIGTRLRLRFFANRSLLHLAAWRGRGPAIAWLLETGADPWREDDSGATAVMTAAWAGCS